MTVSQLDYCFSVKRMTKEQKKKLRDELDRESAEDIRGADHQPLSPHYKAI